MTEEFIDLEKQWLDLLMAVDFLGKDVIERQLAEAYVANRVVESTEFVVVTNVKGFIDKQE